MGQNKHDGIKVSIDGTDYYTYTDVIGKYQLDVPVNTTYSQLRFEKHNYNTGLSKEKNITVQQNGIFTLQSYVLSIQAKDLCGQALVENATNHKGILLEVLGTTINATTDEQGNYCLLSVPIGSYTLKASYIYQNGETPFDMVITTPLFCTYDDDYTIPPLSIPEYKKE